MNYTLIAEFLENPSCRILETRVSFGIYSKFRTGSSETFVPADPPGGSFEGSIGEFNDLQIGKLYCT